MKKMIDINVIINEIYADPQVNILTRERTEQIESIIYAIENATENGFPLVKGRHGEKIVPISQRDIVRFYIEGRVIHIQTDDDLFTTKQSLSALENILNAERFIRISQSEIINLHKVKCFDVTRTGTVEIEFDNGIHSWVARSRVKEIKSRLMDMFITKED